MKLKTYFDAMERSASAIGYFATLGDGDTMDKYNDKYVRFRNGLIKRMERLEYKLAMSSWKNMTIENITEEETND